MLDARGAIDALMHRRDTLDREIIELPASPWAVQVGRLRCLRGIDTLTAVGLCAEIGDELRDNLRELHAEVDYAGAKRRLPISPS